MIIVLIVTAFSLHWFTLRPLGSAEERLPYCRGTYLSYSLMLVLYAWYMWFLSAADSHFYGWSASIFVALGMTVSFIGDFFNLQFPAIKQRIEEPLFYGIISFFLAQIFYILAIFQALSWSEFQFTYFYPLLIAFLVVPAVIFYLRVYNRNRPPRIMAMAFSYGFILCFMVALSISAAWNHAGVWYTIAAGGLFFLLSDAVMGETTIHGRHPVFEYQVPWLTYLIAQGLIIQGFSNLSG